MRLQYQAAELLAKRRRAGVAAAHHGPFLLFQVLAEQVDLRRLAGPIYSVEGEKQWP